MANQIQIKRTSVSGRAANATTLSNPGELALNLPDGIMYSTNGSVIFEIGANTTNSQVTGTLTVNAISANGSVGTSGQVLTSNGTTTYWSSAAGGADVVVDGDFASNGILKRTAAGVYGIVTDNSANWNTAFGWGDHSSAGYITDYTVTEGDVTAHQAALSITESQISDLGTYQVQLSEGAFVNGDKTKLDGIETGADVTDATNVEAAGALMDSELTNAAAVKGINQALTTTSDVTHSVVRFGNSNFYGVMSGANPLFLFDSSDYFAYIRASDLWSFTIGGTNAATLSLAGLRLRAQGATVDEFSTDGTLAGDSDTAVPTEKAVKTYVDNNAGGGDVVKLYTIDPGTDNGSAGSSNNSLIFTDFDSAYFMYTFEFDGIKPDSGDEHLRIEVSLDGGSTWQTGGSFYQYTVISHNEDAAETRNQTDSSRYRPADTNSVGRDEFGFSGTMKLWPAAHDSGSGGHPRAKTDFMMENQNQNIIHGWSVCRFNTSSAINGVRIYWDGNRVFDQNGSQIVIYGHKK